MYDTSKQNSTDYDNWRQFSSNFARETIGIEPVNNHDETTEITWVA